MAIDLTALKAKLAAKKALETQNENTVQPASVPSIPVVSVDPVVREVPVEVTEVAQEVVTAATATPTIGAGTARTVSIDHMDFLTKMQELEAAIHGQHPKMPVLLMLIHKQLTTDPELVSILTEEEIGVIVNGLKIQTKTELVGTVLKQSKARDKKTKLSADMF